MRGDTHGWLVTSPIAHSSIHNDPNKKATHGGAQEARGGEEESGTEGREDGRAEGGQAAGAHGIEHPHQPSHPDMFAARDALKRCTARAST